MGYVGTRLQVDCERLHRAGADHMRGVANHYADCTKKLADAANAQLGLPADVQLTWRSHLGTVHGILSETGRNIGEAGDGLVFAAEDYAGRDLDNADEIKKHDFEDLPELPRRPPEPGSENSGPSSDAAPPEDWKD